MLGSELMLIKTVEVYKVYWLRNERTIAKKSNRATTTFGT